MINYENDEGQTLLDQAINNGNMTLIKLLIEGYWADGRTEYLWMAVKRNRLELVEYLLGKARGTSAIINNENDEGQTLLELAINNENLGIVKLLVNKRAKVKLEYLRMAVKRNLFEIMEYLLLGVVYRKSQEDIINDKNAEGQTLFELAISSGNLDIVKLLVEKGAKINPKALKLADESGNQRIIDFLENVNQK